ncbi:hypothetical protein TVAG_062800 [Trichomonas vaginalis G3]|uniref:Uncharacterized protein n=1 Tax=Trichomonas vaginalis (strain ATCC PRA-98 / G3) TaxID=412133 RepID=A2DLP2_TRIV3|nr:hypothetical protein TVAGG3_0580920 [Trichomonas vaginalis G3]EAY18675.1 hypothetical protein TVAG_062800 [Trichomonas vaginalis G3]KAI5522574.1 hypothetical protein TVAGG3_0580920 [Trichomonas vaginalis G3]|eukprot:XP_001579661.1 hypothetical protein [Trichomonas vaginalis G3]
MSEDSKRIAALTQYIKEEKKLNDDAAQLLAKLAYGFAQHNAAILNQELKSGDVQTNQFRKILEEDGFEEISEKIGDRLSEILIQKKAETFERLKECSFVSKNFHFEFARQLLQSRHKESVQTIAEYSDDEA